MSEDTKECSYCKMEFKTQKIDKLYCSEKCAEQAQNTRWRMNPENKIKVQNYQKEKILELRKNVYSILGNKCVKCGITDFDVLNIDHIEPIGKDRKPTINIYYQIIKFPKEAIKHYQLLCRNCNWKKMIENNEHKPKDTNNIYAYEYQIQAIYAELNNKIEDIKSELGLKNNNINTISPLDDLAKIAYPLRESYTVKNKINVNKLKIIILKENIHIGYNRTYELKNFLEMKHPKDFSKISWLEKTQKIETIEG